MRFDQPKFTMIRQGTTLGRVKRSVLVTSLRLAHPLFDNSISALVQGRWGHAENESMQGGSWKQPEKAINEAPDTITDATSKSGPKWLDVDRTGIADYLAWDVFVLAVVFGKQ